MLILVLNRPFLAYQHTQTFLCLSGLFMLTSANIPFYACQAFLCLTDDKFVQIMPISVEKNEMDLSRNDVFFGDSLSGWKI